MGCPWQPIPYGFTNERIMMGLKYSVAELPVFSHPKT